MKTWTHHFVYAFRGVAKHHCIHIRVKAHAIGVSELLLLLNASLILAKFLKARIQAIASFLYVFYLFYIIGNCF